MALDRFVIADLCGRLPFEDAYFDLVYANFVIEHLDVPETALREWRRVLRPDGALVILTSNRANPFLAGLIGALERPLPPRLRSTIVAWYRPA